MPVIPGVNYAGAKFFPEPVVHGGNLTTQAGIIAAGGTPSVSPLIPAGTGAAISAQVGTDQAGSFVLTAGTFPTIGTLCSVVFATALPAAPASVNVTAANTTSGTAAAITVAATALSASGFSVVPSAALTLNSTYLMSYQVFRQS